eukprot:5412685-Amphidinium_carterae.1
MRTSGSSSEAIHAASWRDSCPQAVLFKSGYSPCRLAFPRMCNLCDGWHRLLSATARQQLLGLPYKVASISPIIRLTFLRRRSLSGLGQAARAGPCNVGRGLQ